MIWMICLVGYVVNIMVSWAIIEMAKTYPTKLSPSLGKFKKIIIGCFVGSFIIPYFGIIPLIIVGLIYMYVILNKYI
jgi:hypothetical protein